MPIVEDDDAVEFVEYDAGQFWAVYPGDRKEPITQQQAEALIGADQVKVLLQGTEPPPADGGGIWDWLMGLFGGDESPTAQELDPLKPTWWKDEVLGVWPLLDGEDNPDLLALSRAIGVAEGLGLIPEDPEAPKTGADEEIIPGEEVGGPPGSFFIRDANGNLTPYTPPKAPEQPGQAGIVTIDGNTFIQQPNGTLTPYSPPREPAQALLSLDEQIDQFILSGRVDEAQRLWDAEQQVRGGGRLSRQQAAQIVFSAFDDLGDITPQQFKEWIDTLAGPEPAQQPQPAPGSLEAQAAVRRDVVPGTSGKVGQGFGGTTGPFGVPTLPGMGTGLVGQSPFAPVPAAPGLSPGFNAQAQEEAEGLGLQGPQPVFQAAPAQVEPDQTQGPGPLTVTNPLMDALRRREAQLRGPGPSGQPLLTGGQEETNTLNAASGGVSTPGPAGQTPASPFQAKTYEPPFSIAGLSPEAQAAIRGGTASVTQSGPGGNFAPFQAGLGGELLPDPSLTPQQQVLNPFEQALFDIGQKQSAQRKQRRFGQTAVPTTIFR